MRKKKFKKIEKITKRENLVYETDKFVYHFHQYETIRSTTKITFAVKITLINAEKNQNNLLDNLIDFNKRIKPRVKEKKPKKSYS